MQRICQVLDVFESGYAWKQRKPSPRTIANEQLTTHIYDVHMPRYHIYGSRRIQAEIIAQGDGVDERKRVVRLMRRLDVCF